MISLSGNERLELEASPHWPNMKFLVNYDCYENVVCMILNSLSYVWQLQKLITLFSIFPRYIFADIYLILNQENGSKNDQLDN